MVTGRNATLAVMSSPVFPRATFQHDDEPIGSLTCPAWAQIRPVCSACAVISEVPGPLFPPEFPAGRRLSAAPPRGIRGGQPDTSSTTPAQRVAEVLRRAARIEPQWVHSPVDHQLHLLTAHGAALAAATGYAHAACGHRMDAGRITLTEPSGSPTPNHPDRTA